MLLESVATIIYHNKYMHVFFKPLEDELNRWKMKMKAVTPYKASFAHNKTNTQDATDVPDLDKL